MSKEIIKQLIQDVIAKEGGYVFHKNDRGSATKYGITIKTLEDYRNDELSDRDVELLSKSEAAEIYEKLYYIAPGINHLPEQIQPIVFDMAVNHGAGRAIKILQQTLWDAGYNAGSVDGIIGQRTIKAAGHAIADMGGDFINSIVSARVDFYEKIIENDPTQAVFKMGWMTRAESFRQVVA